MKKKILILLGLTIPLFINAQEAIAVSGGNALGNDGSVSYTLGQIAYTTNLAQADQIIKEYSNLLKFLL